MHRGVLSMSADHAKMVSYRFIDVLPSGVQLADTSLS
jgi:hypothetical protein